MTYNRVHAGHALSSSLARSLGSSVRFADPNCRNHSTHPGVASLSMLALNNTITVIAGVYSGAYVLHSGPRFRLHRSLCYSFSLSKMRNFYCQPIQLISAVCLLFISFRRLSLEIHSGYLGKILSCSRKQRKINAFINPI